MDTTTFLTAAMEAIVKSEKVINHYFKNEVRVSLKDDKSPVTIADQEAEKIIISTIKSYFPSHSFLGEESGTTAQSSEYLWIIDPIDGTKNYLRRIPLFATQIALMKNGEPILGISNAPALHERIVAEKGKGAYLNTNRLYVSNVATLEQSYLCFGGLKYFQKNNQLQNLMTLINNVQGNRGIGDFWCYHLLAQGKIDIMIEAQIKIWDIAAVSIIVEEAGGKVTDIQGNTLSKNTRSLVATNTALHSVTIEHFK